jgi:hypothetical protein
MDKKTGGSEQLLIGSVLVRMFIFVLFALAAPVHANQLGDFQRVETETLDKQDFVFPDDLQGSAMNIVMLAMSNEEENGTWQGDALAEWYVGLAEQGVLTDDVLAYHFSVMKVPWFIKGLIRGGMAKSYAGKMPLNQAGAIFLKDLDSFAGAPGIALDGQPTLVLVAPDGELLELFKGEVSDEGVAAIGAAVAGYLDEPLETLEGVGSAGAPESVN